MYFINIFNIAGSSQVRWNGLSPHTLATTHDGDIKIWDQRKGNSPVQYIAAHLTKVVIFIVFLHIINSIINKIL